MNNFDVHEWNKKRYLNESKEYLEKLAATLNNKHKDLTFTINFPDSDIYRRIDVRGSQQDMYDWGNKNHGKKYGEYEVFHTDDDDRGEIVRIVRSSQISKS